MEKLLRDWPLLKMRGMSTASCRLALGHRLDIVSGCRGGKKLAVGHGSVKAYYTSEHKGTRKFLS
jgi:hypothetical protein